jgi:hypothetical protein
MSLAINPEKVTRVLLSDGWHKVHDFFIDSYEFIREGESVPVVFGESFGAGWSESPQVPSNVVKEPVDRIVYCPFKEIKAVAY